jgi:signal transduction histidine kinase/ActR/RegA family two-component response regulator
MRRKDGKKIFVTFEGRVGWNAEEAFVRAHCVFVNMTERRMLEDQLRQVQKMESVGRLAGGVAHDFNNMLGVIIGHAEMALREVDESDPLYASLQEILKASQRSVDLTRQMLAFARRQTVNPQVLDLNKAVSGMFKMLRRLIGEDVDLIQKPGPGLWPVKMDPAQFDQILANLAINARDAISGVGAVTIETGNTSLGAAYCGTHAGAVPGEYVFVTVSDTGAGMDRETLEHIFEPFFTTKEVGKGTGLGLATVYGIVKQNNGFIDVLTAPERGTAFRIYLPRTWAKIEEAPARSQDKFSGGSETVLLVEDEEAILNLIKTILGRSGYTVLSALSPREALTLARSYAGTIHVLVTDVVMPEMNGRELAERISAIKPGLKTLYMSGYTADVIAHQGVLHEGVQFLQKPMTAGELTDKIRDVLDRDVISSKNLPRS